MSKISCQTPFKITKTIYPTRLSHSVCQDLSLQNYTDVSLVPEEGEESSVRVHSLLLSAASPYLAGLLGGAGEHTVCLPGSVTDPNQPDPHVFGLLDPDPDLLVRGMDPDPDPSIIMQK
jgi:hypothetical protein